MRLSGPSTRSLRLAGGEGDIPDPRLLADVDHFHQGLVGDVPVAPQAHRLVLVDVNDSAQFGKELVLGKGFAIDNKLAPPGGCSR